MKEIFYTIFGRFLKNAMQDVPAKTCVMEGNVIYLDNYKKLQQLRYSGTLSYRWDNFRSRIRDKELANILGTFPIGLHENVLLKCRIKVKNGRDIFLPVNKELRQKRLDALKRLSFAFQESEMTCLQFLEKITK